MKPLNLSRPVQTRDGRKVRIICTDGPAFCGEQPITGFIEGNNIADNWQAGGNYWRKCTIGQLDQSKDLINVPEKRVVWVNIYEQPLAIAAHGSRGTADKSASVGRIACVRVEFTEGEGIQ